MSLIVSFVLSFFPLDVLDEIWDLIESVSEGFLTYFFKEKVPLPCHLPKETRYLLLNIKLAITFGRVQICVKP